MNVDDHISTASLLATEGDYDSAIQLLSNLPDEMQADEKLQKALKKLFTDKMDAMQDAMQAQAARQRQVAVNPAPPQQGMAQPGAPQPPMPKVAAQAHAVARVARPVQNPAAPPIKMPPMPIPGMPQGAHPQMMQAALQAARMAQQQQQLLAAQQARPGAVPAPGMPPLAKPPAPQGIVPNIPPAVPQQLLDKRFVAPPVANQLGAEPIAGDLLQVAPQPQVSVARVPEAPPVVKRKGAAKINKAPLPATPGFSPAIETYWRAVLEQKESAFKSKVNAFQSEIREANKMISELGGEVPSTRRGAKRKVADDSQTNAPAAKKQDAPTANVEDPSEGSEEGEKI